MLPSIAARLQSSQSDNNCLANDSLVDCLCDAIKNSKESSLLDRLLAELENDPSVLQQLDNQGFNPVHVAVTTGNTDALKALLKHKGGLDLEIRSKEGYTALQYARMCQNEEALRLLIAAGCSIHYLMNDSPSVSAGTKSSSDGQTKSSSKETSSQHLQYPMTDSFYWSVGVHQEAIKRYYCDLIEYMYPEYIVPQLVQAKYLSLAEVERIIKQENHRKQAMILLSTLERKGQKAYHEFLRTLKNEKKQIMHEELAKKLIECCKDCQSSQDHETSLEQVTMFYDCDDSSVSLTPGSRPYHSSANQSILLESGFHSASLSSSNIHGSSFSNRKTHSQSHERRGKLNSRERVVSLLHNRKPRCNTTMGFNALEKIKERQLKVTDVTVLCEKVKRKAPRAPTPASDISGGSACIVASNMSPRPYALQDETEEEMFEASPQPGVNVLFHVSDEESDNACGDDDVIEKDNTSFVPSKSFSSPTSPIDIPSRSSSNSSFSSPGSPYNNSSSKQVGSPSPSITLPSSPCKDLSAIPPVKLPWTQRIVKWLLKPSMHTDSARPAYVIGCKLT